MIFRCLSWEEVCRHMKEFSKWMQISSYDQVFREQVVTSALKVFDQMIERCSWKEQMSKGGSPRNQCETG